MTRAARSKKPQRFTRRQIGEALIDVFRGMYGGDGWDDPRLNTPEMWDLVINFSSWPPLADTVDASMLRVFATEMEEQGFDPRHLVHLIRSKRHSRD